MTPSQPGSGPSSTQPRRTDAAPHIDAAARAPMPAAKARIRELLERYPDVGADEKREIIGYLRNGPLLDIGLLKGDEAVRYKIAAFEQEQKAALSTSPGEWLALLAVLAIIVAICAAIWDSGL